MIKKIRIVRGANGISLAKAQEMARRNTTEKVYIVDKATLQHEYYHSKIVPF